MIIDSIQNGIVIDHITAGKSMELYQILGLDQLDCTVAILKNVTSGKLGCKAFGQAVAQAVAKRLETLDRRAIAGASWAQHGAVIITRDLAEAATLSNRVAPEHLELCTADPEALSRQITHAGAIFLGQYTPEAIGDYIGGPNHVLPTARSARFSSGLSVLDFLKRTTLARMTPAALKAIGPAAERLAQSESLQAHGLSVRARLDRLNG